MGLQKVSLSIYYFIIIIKKKNFNLINICKKFYSILKSNLNNFNCLFAANVAQQVQQTVMHKIYDFFLFFYAICFI